MTEQTKEQFEAEARMVAERRRWADRDDYLFEVARSRGKDVADALRKRVNEMLAHPRA